MDQIRPRLLVLIAAAGLLVGARADRPLPQDFPIRAAHWLSPEGRERALAEEPPECAAPPQDEDGRLAFEIGRTAFRAPLLLGGQAARAGLRCESCHSNGRRNPDFDFPGLSGEPGTADVTASEMSSHRGNGVFDPRRIPDLAVPAKVSRDSANRELEKFMHGLIVEEFDGAEPPPRILAGLAAYVRAIGRTSCDADVPVPIGVTGRISDVKRAMTAARSSLRRGDRDAARLMLGAARSLLGQIDERYAAIPRVQRSLRGADGDLRAIIASLDGGEDVGAQIGRWESRFPKFSEALIRNERLSLFNRQRLHRALDMQP